MLKARILTVLVLLPLLLCALFLLPGFYWALSMLLIVLLGVAEWSRIAAYSKPAAGLYVLVTLLLGLSLLLFTDIEDLRADGISQWIYALSVLFWLLIVPFWLIQGWQDKLMG